MAAGVPQAEEEVVVEAEAGKTGLLLAFVP